MWPEELLHHDDRPCSTTSQALAHLLTMPTAGAHCVFHMFWSSEKSGHWPGSWGARGHPGCSVRLLLEPCLGSLSQHHCWPRSPHIWLYFSFLGLALHTVGAWCVFCCPQHGHHTGKGTQALGAGVASPVVLNLLQF